MDSLLFSSFLSSHGLKVGDKVRTEWKNMQVEGIILPAPAQGAFLSLKLSSGYNTGLALSQVKHIEKLPSPAHSFEEKERTASQPKKMPADIESKPGISLITAGGTIGSRTDYKTGGVSALMNPEELLSLIPEIGSFAHFHSILSPFSKLSENIVPKDWIQLAQICQSELNKPEVKGVLLTHGTDTLHYTAAALSFMLRNLNKPVVLVGAQRSSDRGSSDAAFNLICASRMALSDSAEVGICMHGTTSDEYCLFNRGTHVRKMHSSRRDAFRPINDVPIARINPEKGVEFLSPHRPRDDSQKVELDAVFDENVFAIKSVPGRKPEIMDHLLGMGVKGFIMEGTGLGHVSEDWIPFIQKATNKGVPVFVTTQTIYGRVNLNVYSNGRLMQEAGAIGLEDMLFEVAYVKLGWVLAHTHNIEKVREMMVTNYAGEITPSSRSDAFLN